MLHNFNIRFTEGIVNKVASRMKLRILWNPIFYSGKLFLVFLIHDFFFFSNFETHVYFDINGNHENFIKTQSSLSIGRNLALWSWRHGKINYLHVINLTIPDLCHVSEIKVSEFESRSLQHDELFFFLFRVFKNLSSFTFRNFNF